MARNTRIIHVLALLALLSVTAVHAQGDLPDLNTVTAETSATDATTDATTAATTRPTTARTTDATTAETTDETTAESTGTTASGTGFTATASFPDSTETVATTTDSDGATATFGLTGLPTIAGAGVPDVVIPYTANAPFMQKSSMPEGTVFIAVGAILGAFGACVLLWRGLVAWSINRSVKRAALASVRGSEKNGWAGAASYNNKGAYYKEYEGASSMSLDHLTSTGKTAKSGKHDDGYRNSSAPPSGLFFSPTAQQNNRVSSTGLDNRSSSYLPAGYYASPSADAPAGGRSSTVIGGSLAPYARHSGITPSPPGSPRLPQSSRNSNYFGGTAISREGLRAPSRDGYGQRTSNLYTQPSTSSLMVGSTSDLPGTRAPSQILDEMFDNHGNGPRERF